MKHYSQNAEQEYILQYFEKRGGRTGHLIDIGANDGETFSNSRALILEGWAAALYEPDPRAFARLEQLYRLTSMVELYPYAVAALPRKQEEFYLHDDSLYSTSFPITHFDGCISHVLMDYLSMEQVQRQGDNPFARFLSIDAEGMDMYILQATDLSGLDLVCIEPGPNREACRALLTEGGLSHEVYYSFENLIMGRP